jgi:hypothetical protein
MYLRLIAIVFFPLLVKGGLNPKQSKILFTENKGQVSDQHYNPRPDVLFGGTDGNMAFHIRNNGISYQLTKADKIKELPQSSLKTDKFLIESMIFQRVDVNWINSGRNFTVEHGQDVPGVSNFILEVCPNGINNVLSYEDVTLKNIYNNIDVHFYGSESGFKYDYIVAPYSDYRQIQLEIKGAVVSILENGDLCLQTDHGRIIEAKPVAFQGNKQLNAKWTIKKNIISIEVENHDQSKELVIDPLTRSWGTFYGGDSYDYGRIVYIDSGGNSFQAGSTSSSSSTLIATVGSYQDTLSGMYDGFIAKFNSSGVRQWGTYYGGTGTDCITTLTTDGAGNIFLTGYTNSTGTVMATLGTQQTTFAGGTYDLFLAKFSSSGMRIWGTYYGGTGFETSTGCTVDGAGNVYVSGYTGSSGLSYLGFQNSFGGWIDGLLIKFSPVGIRIWATYYGGSGLDNFMDHKQDLAGNIFVVGNSSTNTSTIIATPGSFQPNCAGMNDGMIVKFNSNGVRQWGTYYGDTDNDGFGSIWIDNSGTMYLAGTSSSSINISTPGCHQPNFAGGISDLILAKFTASGTPQWCTYYGGSGIDQEGFCTLDAAGNVYLSGYTDCNTGTVIATPSGYQSVYGGGNQDMLVAQFDANGVRQWGTYFGGPGDEWGSALVCNNAVYMGGYSTTTVVNIMATPGSNQPFFGGGNNDTFLEKLIDCSSILMNLSATPSVICQGNSSTLTAISGADTYTWSTGSTNSVIVVSPTINTTFTLAGTIAGCSVSPVATISVMVVPYPTVSVNSGSICPGQSFTIIPSGAINYTISGGNNIVSPGATTNYSVTGSSYGCAATNTAIAQVMVFPNPTITVNSSTSSVCYGTGATLTASGAQNYTWSGGSNSNSIVVSPTANAVYSVTGIDINSCSNSASVSISVLPLPGITITVVNNNFCQGGTTTLIANGAITYTWNGVAVTNPFIVSPTVSTVYTVSGTGGNGCSNASSVSVNVLALPALSVSASPNPLCIGKNATITVAGANAYTWSNGALVNSIQVGPTINTTYSVTGTGTNSCIDSTAITVTVSPLPTVSLSSTAYTICANSNVTLSASGANTYSWNTGDTISVIVVSPSASSVYIVTGYNQFGCSNQATVFEQVKECVGLKENFYAENLSIYPNPVSRSLTIDNCPESTRIDIYDAIGQNIMSRISTASKETIDLNNYSHGIYLLHLELSDKSTLNFKLVKE